MSILEAVIALATVVKQLSDDAAHNISACTSLSHRVSLIPRLLEGFPDPTLLDDVMMQNLFQQLRKAHDLIKKYNDMGRMGRAIRSTSMKEDFTNAEKEIGDSVRDLTLAVGIFSASKLSTLSTRVTKGEAQEIPAEEDCAQPHDDSMMGLEDFGNMCESVESLDRAATIFQYTGLQSDTSVAICSVAVLGNKVMALNVPMHDNADSLATKAACAEESDEDEAAATFSGTMDCVGKKESAGIVIFHIDNTTSMKKFSRMDLTKKTLLDVIPNYLRQGFRVIMNAWASDPVTKGKIQTKEVLIPDDLLFGDGDSNDALTAYFEQYVFTILSPQGKTDIYGSFFQLLRQCHEICGEVSPAVNKRSPLLLFMLTDGKHTHFDYPLHTPTVPGEDYFGVYAANLNDGTKFGRTEAEFSVTVCEEFLRRELNSLVTILGLSGASKSPGYQITCTIIGIGDADTGALSSLASSLGETASFYGITKVDQIEEVFNNINIADSSNQLKLLIPRTGEHFDSTFPFQYCVEFSSETDTNDNRAQFGTISGCCGIADPNLSQRLHDSSNLQLQFGNNQCIELISKSSTSPFFTSFKKHVKGTKEIIDDSVINERSTLFFSVLTQLKELPARPYLVTSESFGTVFSQLVRDKQSLSSIKSTLFSRRTRKMRNTVMFEAVALWLRELDDLVEAQISSYRMNVEDEVLSTLAKGSVEKRSDQYVQPSQLVLERLQHNLKNTGKSTHRIKRLMTAINNLRDRSVQLASRLLSRQDLSLEISDLGIVLNIINEDSISSKLVLWKTCCCISNRVESMEEVVNHETLCQSKREKIQNVLLTLFDPSSVGPGNIGTKEVDKPFLEVPISSSLSLTFPCVLLKCSGSQFSLVHAPTAFTTLDMCAILKCDKDQKYKSLQKAAISNCIENTLCGVVFDSAEIYDVCHTSDHHPGAAIPMVTADMESGIQEFNMILPLAYTPLLISLYVQRGRLFHSAINVTGDCMALSPVSLQWGKFFFDALLKIPLFDAHVGIQGLRSAVWVEQAIYALSSFSYAIDSYQLAPKKDIILSAFDANPADKKEKNADRAVVLPRENIFTGFECPLGVSSIVAISDDLNMNNAHVWNILTRTTFSRMCEAIAGHKNIRYGHSSHSSGITSGSESKSGNEPAKATTFDKPDPGLFEDSYRTLLGELQIMLRHRLHVEWTKLSLADKLNVLQEAGPRDVLLLIQQIVDRYLSQFNIFGLNSWSKLSAMLQRALNISKYGIGKIKQELIEYSDMRELIKSTVQHPLLPDNAIPIFYSSPEGKLCVREIAGSDYEDIVSYIDALVVTKASPKIVYKPVSNPSHPTINDTDPSLKGSIDRCKLDFSLPVINIGFIGNVHSGKSSILGRLILDFGMVRPDTISKYAAEAERVGLSSSSKLAWILDKTAEERRRSVTINSSWLGFQSCHRRFSVVDNPGHADFAKNSVNGIFQSDIAVVVVSAEYSEFVSYNNDSRDNKSHIKEHLMVAFCFGIRHIVVAVNKMDLVKYSEESYAEICEEMNQIFKKTGFKSENVVYVPVSAVKGVNLTSVCPSKMPWYSGDCLLDTFDNIKIPKRVFDKPLRVPIDEVRTAPGIGTVLCGRVECGYIAEGDKLCVEPCGISSLSVVSIETYHSKMERALAGENIGIAVRPKREEKDILQRMKRGFVVSKVGETPTSVMDRFEAQLFVVNGSSIKVGYRPAITSHLEIFSATVIRLVEILGKNNSVISENPTEVLPGQTVVLEMKAERRFAGDTIHDNPRLSRFLIKANRIVVGLGFIRRKLS